MHTLLVGLCACSLWCASARAQLPADTTTRQIQRVKDTALQRAQHIQQLPARYVGDVQAKAGKLSQGVTTQTTRYLGKLSRLESKILGKIQKVYPNATLPPGNYNQYLTAVQQGSTAGLPGGSPARYLAGLDTMKTSLAYLQAGTQQVDGLENRLDASASAEQYVQLRNQQLSQLLTQYPNVPGATGLLNKYRETGYYYEEQIKSYKDMLNDPDKMEKTALSLLSKTSAFQKFFGSNSQFAALFPQPSAPAPGASAASLVGLQTRSQVQQLLSQRLSAGGQDGMQALQGQVSQAQGQMSALQDKLMQPGGQSAADMDLPPDFKPNTQKTKTFLKRLEYGANIQFAQGTAYFPATANLGGSLGYKINDKSTAGVGLSYEAGMGSGWDHIQFSSQAVGLRSFMDWKIKGTWYVMGGYEMNYLTQFSSIAALYDKSAWQKSALLGLEKKYKISSKLQGNVQLLFDLLYKNEIPQGQMVKFRVGYNF